MEVFGSGAGPLVLMIASLGRPASDFDGLAAQLADAGYRALRYNARGIGRSSGTVQGLTLLDLAADAAAVIEAEMATSGAAPAVLIGHAFGQRVARMLATERPELVRAVVLLAAGGQVPPEPAAHQALGEVFELHRPDDEHLRAVQLAFFADGHDASVWRHGWHPATATMQLAATAASPVAHWWAGGRAPLLVIQGLQDRIAAPANGRALQQAYGARVELVEIDGAGHALLPEQPQRLARTILDYLQRL